MPIQVVWVDIEETILRLEFIDPVSWDDFDGAMDYAVTLAKTSAHRVDIILNTGSIPMPSGSPLPHLRRAFKNIPENVKLLVAYSENQFARTISSALAPLVIGNIFKIVNSLEEAQNTIYKERSRLSR